MFAGKRVVITGGASGIGECLGKKFLAEGAIVFAWDINESKLGQLEYEARKYDNPFHGMVVDVTEPNQVKKACEHVTRSHKRIDLWINNAGTSGLGSFREGAPEDFQKVMRLNFDAVVLGTRVALEAMERRGSGWIINVASVAGLIPAPYLAAYSASKHAVVGFTRALREELRLQSSSIKLALVCPGFVDTAMIAGEGREDDLRFPDWLRWMVSTPEKVATNIISSLNRGQLEISPTLSGSVLTILHKAFPDRVLRGSSMLLSHSFRDWVMNRYTVG